VFVSAVHLEHPLVIQVQ